MKTIYKIVCSLLLLQIVILLSDGEEASAAGAVCGSESYLEYFSKFGDTFVKGGDLATDDQYTGKKVSVNCTYLNRGYFFFGNATDANATNSAQGGRYGANTYYPSLGLNRFLGITYGGHFVYASNIIHEGATRC